MQPQKIHISDDFSELTTKTIDERERISIGKYLKTFKRVRLYQNKAGEILIRPIVEIPASELWLYKNKQASKSVQTGLKDVAEGKISKLDTKSL